MKKTGHVKKLIGSIVYLGLAMMLFPQTSFGQVEWAKDTGFVSREYRPRWFQEYENFGRYDLRKAPRYFTEAYETGINAAGATTYNTRQVMSKVSYDPFGNFLLPGGSIYNVKWDTSRYGATSGNTASDPTAAAPFYYAASVFNNLMITSDEFSDWKTKLIFGTTIRTFFTSSTLMMKNFNGFRWDASNRKNSVTLIAQPGTPGSISTLTMLGAHWQSILGDKLKVGGTFINRQRGTRAYSHTDIDNGIAGMRDTPRYIYLVLSDCSPTNTSNGPTIYDIRTFINGNDLTSQVPMRVFKIKDVLSSKRFYNGAFQRQYIFPVATGQDFYPRKDTDYAAADWFLTALNLANAKENMFSKTDITNFFGILNLPDPSNPSDPQGRLYAADMSLGYQQATGTDVVIYEFMIPQEARDVKFKVLVANYYNIDLISAYYKYTQGGEASWNDQPFSPTYKDKWSVGYDVRNVARSPMNVRDLSNMQWVTIAYDRWTGWNVYGIDAQFVWGGLKINGEINEYNALFSYPVNENLTGGGRHKETTRAWFANLEQDFGKWGFGGEAYNYPLNYMKYNPVIENPYPGNIGIDVDWDMLNDTYWGTAPYLTYNYDLSPTGTYVAFGDDFNNNGTIDQRESYTTPYAIGYNGNHFFLKLKPRDFLITLGRYNYKSVSVSYDNLMTYLKWEKFGKYSNFMEYSWQNRIEKRMLRYFYNSYYESSHSWKNTSFFHTRLNTKNLNVF
ncbi:MAG: hypothetical protein Q8O92_04370, partial [Candidatus Latescibacter sp.]|nr:hypothetical protein [Candidatus Latescibacter sp.]